MAFEFEYLHANLFIELVFIIAVLVSVPFRLQGVCLTPQRMYISTFARQFYYLYYYNHGLFGIQREFCYELSNQNYA